MIRNRHKIGDYLMVSDESGFTFYKSEMVERWDGAWVHHSETEPRHPQDFVRAKNDPIALKIIRPATAVSAACAHYWDLFVVGTTVETPRGPADHLFNLGVGEAEIGCNFVVR